MERKFFAVKSKHKTLLEAIVRESAILGWYTENVQRSLEVDDILFFDSHKHFNLSRVQAGPNVTIAGTGWCNSVLNLPEDWELVLQHLKGYIEAFKAEQPVQKIYTDSAFTKEDGQVLISLREVCKIFDVGIHQIKMTV